MLARSLALVLVLSSFGCVKIDEERAGRAQPQTQTQPVAPSPSPAAPKAAAKPEPREPVAAAPAPAAPTNGFEVREPAAPSPVGVTLVDAGAEPRERVRIGGAAGQRRRLRVELGMSAAMQLGTRDVPPTELPALQVLLDTEVLASDAERTKVAIAVTEVIVPTDTSASTRVQHAIARTADELRATKGHIVLAADGHIESFELAGAAAAKPGATAGLEPELGGLAAALQEMLPVVPAEPIGEGARWRSVQHVRRDTVTLQQVAEWTATREGEAIVLVAASEHDLLAPAQGDALARVVERQSGSTRARVVWRSGVALPSRAEAQVTTTTLANMELVGAAQRVSMRVELALQLVDAAE